MWTMSSAARGQTCICCVHCGTKALDNADTNFCTKCGRQFVNLRSQVQNSHENTPTSTSAWKDSGGRNEASMSANSSSVVSSQENRRRTVSFNEFRLRK